MSKRILFENYRRDCPWYGDEGDCTGQTTYNGHLNDPIYTKCKECNCPVFYWVDSLATHLEYGVV